MGESLGGNSQGVVRWYDWMMTKPHDLLYVAQAETGEIVGYALGRPGLSDIAPFASELMALHVRQSYQRQGVGRNLMVKMAEQFQKLACASLMLWALAKNPACSLYEKLGGQLIGKREIEPEEGEKAVEVAYGWQELDRLEIFAEGA